MKQATKYKLSIVLPGGNQTALVNGIVAKNLRKRINDKIMRDFPKVEQVGFYKYDSKLKNSRLEMAGGEFCGNALRSLAFLLLKGQKGEIKVDASGTNRPLRAGVKSKNNAWAEMPPIKNAESISKISAGVYKVEIPGITYLITDQGKKTNSNYLKKKAKELLNSANLLYSQKASGVIFLKGNPSTSNYSIEPIVWVRDIKTLFRETACASGSAATSIYLFKTQGILSPFKIKQPSGEILTINLTERKKIIKTVVSGPIKRIL